MGTLGEPARFKLEDGDRVLNTLFDVENESNGIGALPFAGGHYTLTVAQDAVELYGIGLRQTVTVRRVDYQIIDMVSDTTGMAVLKIRKY